MDAPEKAVVNWWRRFIVGWCLFLFAFILVWTIFAAYATQTTVQHTWLLPSDNPNGLRSDRYSFHMASLVSVMTVSWVLPMFMLILVAYPSGNGPRIAFTIFMILIGFYFSIILINWGLQYGKVNDPKGTNARNPFNDDRWCLIYRANAPTYCSNLAVPTGVDNELANIQIGDLGVHQWMMATYWMLFVYIWFIVFSVLGVWFIFSKRVGAWIKAYTVPSAPPSASFTDTYEEKGDGDEEQGYYIPPTVEKTGASLSLPTRFQKNYRKMKK